MELAEFEFTGERFIPARGGVQIHFEHLQRYLIAAGLVKPGASVLDYGSGEGYGSKLLSEKAGRVLGVDVGVDVVAAANKRYSNPTLKYVAIESGKVPLEDASVDLVTCFEVIEHLHDQAEVVAELARVLKPDGILLMSTPDKQTYTEVPGFQNPYHVSEMTFPEFDALLAAHFPERLFYRQRFETASFFLPAGQVVGAPMAEKILEFRGGRKDGVLDRAELRPCSAVYYVAACSRQQLPAQYGALSEFVVDERGAYTNEFLEAAEKLKKHVMVLEGGVGERDAEIKRLTDELATAKAQVRGLSNEVVVVREERDLRVRRLDELLQELEQVTRQRHEVATQRDQTATLLAESERLAQAREQELEARGEQLEARGEQLEALTEALAAMEGDLEAERKALAAAVEKCAAKVRRVDELENEQQSLRRAREREASRVSSLTHELSLANERASSMEHRLKQSLEELEFRKQHIMRLEGGVIERDDQIDLLGRELIEVKQSGALRVGRAISKLLPSTLKQRVYDPFRKSEASTALLALRGTAPTSVLQPAAQPSPQHQQPQQQLAAPVAAPTVAPGLTFAFIVPVYNHAKYLPLMLESLCAQTRPADEIILIDDCSPDPAVRKVLRAYEGRHKFKVLYNDTNLGISETTNCGIRVATSSHLAFVDCDDLVEPNALELVEAFLRSRPEVDFVYSNRIDIDSDGHERERLDFRNRATVPAHEALMIGMFTSHLKVISSAALNDVGGFKSAYDLSQDYDMALRLAERRTLGHLNAYVYRHRVHNKQQSQVNAEAQEKMTRQIREDSLRRLALRSAETGPLVSIVMLTYNRPEITRQSIESILTRVRGRFELVIFDNASDLATLQMLSTFEHDPRVRLIRGERNFGVSGGRRRAAKQAKGDYLLFLDSDIVVEDRDLLVKLVERLLVEPRAGATCCKVVFPNGTVQFNGGELEAGPRGRTRFSLVDSGKRHDDLSTLKELDCDWIPGGATMWRREAHDRFEPSDEMLGAFEDNEMCLRVRKAGVKLVNCPTAIVIHHHHTFRTEQDTRYLKSRYDRERIITSMGVLLRDHGLLVHDDDVYRMVGLDPSDQDGLVRRLTEAAAAGKTNATA